jgi:hypothetical protein
VESDKKERNEKRGYRKAVSREVVVVVVRRSGKVKVEGGRGFWWERAAGKFGTVLTKPS